MNKFHLIFVLGILSISCKEKKGNMQQNSSIIITENEQIIQKILDIPSIQWIYHPKKEERLPIKILETKQIHKDVQLTKFDKKVRIISFLEMKNEKIDDVLLITYAFVDKDTISFKLLHHIEGVVVKGKLIHKEYDREIHQIKVVETDIF